MAPLKSELLRVAGDLLEKEGVDALSLRRVAAAAGVSHMAPYRHFDKKDALLAAVAVTGFRDLVAAIDDAVSKEETGPLKSRAIGMAYVGFACERPALYRLMFGPRYADPEAFPELADAVNAAATRCFEAVTLLNPRQGRQDLEAAETLGIAIWSLAHGLATLLIDGRIDVDDEPGGQAGLAERVLDIIGRIADADVSGKTATEDRPA